MTHLEPKKEMTDFEKSKKLKTKGMAEGEGWE